MDRDRTGRRNPNYRHGAAGHGRETPEYKVWRFQGHNTRRTHRVALDGEEMSLTQACRRLGLPVRTFYTRLERG